MELLDLGLTSEFIIEASVAVSLVVLIDAAKPMLKVMRGMRESDTRKTRYILLNSNYDKQICAHHCLQHPNYSP